MRWVAIARRGLAQDWLRRILGGYLQKWVVLGLLIGAVAGVGAILFFAAIQLATDVFLGKIAGHEPPLPRGEGPTQVLVTGHAWLIPLATTLGGLLSGLIVFWLAPEAEGHGTDAAIEAFHRRAGRIRARIPPIKLIASAITIGSGGSAGREGPTAQIAAGFGSWLGEVFRLSPQDRRIAVAVGLGAGIGAIFKAPLGGAILSGEILYVRDFELEALVPGFIASVVGYSIFAAWSGWTPIFGDGIGLRFTEPQSLLWYAVLGVVAGLAGIAYVRAFYGTRDLFRRLRLPPHLKPALGGLGVGLIALAFPQVLSMGYGWLQFAIEGDTQELPLRIMLLLIGLKIVATSLSIGSGGSGGVFAPGLFVGGMVGGGLWGLLDGRVPWLPQAPAPFVIVGMMALFGGVAKAPIAVMLMVAEMTGEFSMVVPAMMATSIAYLVTGDVRIYESQVPTRADSPAHRGEYTVPLIQAVTVGEAMQRAVVTASPDEGVSEVERRMMEHGLRGLPVLDQGRLVGMFTATDALRARQQGQRTVRDAMSTLLVVAYPGESLHAALRRMTRAGVSHLPVVERERPDRLLGIITMRELASALDRQVDALARATRPLPLLLGADDPLRSVRVAEAMSRRFVTVPATLSLRRVANQLAAAGDTVALVLNEQERLVGIVTVSDLAREDADPDQPVIEVASRDVVVAHPGQTVSEAIAQPGAQGLRQLPVVEEDDLGLRPVGMLRRSDVVAAYLRVRDRQARIAQRMEALAHEHRGEVATLELTLEPHDPAVGRTLADLRLPADAVVTGVVRYGRMLIPRGQVRLEAGDRVQVLSSTKAEEEAVARFKGQRC